MFDCSFTWQNLYIFWVKCFSSPHRLLSVSRRWFCCCCCCFIVYWSSHCLLGFCVWSIFCYPVLCVLLVLQSYWWGRERWLLYLSCRLVTVSVLWLTSRCMGWSAVCDCGIFWSHIYSLAFLVYVLTRNQRLYYVEAHKNVNLRDCWPSHFTFQIANNKGAGQAGLRLCCSQATKSGFLVPRHIRCSWPLSKYVVGRPTYHRALQMIAIIEGI